MTTSRHDDAGPAAEHRRIPLRYRLEYAGLRFLAALLDCLPYRAALAVAWWHAALAHVVLRFGVREARRRIRFVFGDALDERAVRRIAWISWRNLLFTGTETIKNRIITLPWLDERYTNHDYVRVLRDHVATGKGAVLAVPHMGSWETAAVACHLNGIPIFSVAAAQKNPLTDAFLNDLRRRPGIVTIARGSGAIKEIIRKLKAGGVLAILPDVRMRTPGVPVPFLGGQANIGEGMAAFARQAGVPIFPAAVRRRGWTRQDPVIYPPIWPDPALPKDEDIRRMTLAVMAIVEDHIRREPEQWFWYNRRWILDPIDPPKHP